jgi:hypothetical protein
MKRISKFAIITLLLSLTLGAATACKKKPATKEEITRQIISDIFDSCKAGKSEDAVKRYNEVLPEAEKARRAIDVSTPDGKQRAERLCNETNNKYGTGYEFGKMETQGEVIGWPVFAKGRNEGQIWAFKEVNGKWTLVDIDSTKR